VSRVAASTANLILIKGFRLDFPAEQTRCSGGLQKAESGTSDSGLILVTV
jgi:hypothetical protein